MVVLEENPENLSGADRVGGKSCPFVCEARLQNTPAKYLAAYTTGPNMLIGVVDENAGFDQILRHPSSAYTRPSPIFAELILFADAWIYRLLQPEAPLSIMPSVFNQIGR